MDSNGEYKAAANLISDIDFATTVDSNSCPSRPAEGVGPVRVVTVAKALYNVVCSVFSQRG
jgi:hypothetical protein